MGAWWAAVYGFAQSQARLKWLSSSSKLPIQAFLVCIQFADKPIKGIVLCVCVCVVVVFGHATWFTESQFPDQGLNLAMKSQNPNH